jgi:hypothetical protein
MNIRVIAHDANEPEDRLSIRLPEDCRLEEDLNEGTIADLSRVGTAYSEIRTRIAGQLDQNQFEILCGQFVLLNFRRYRQPRFDASIIVHIRENNPDAFRNVMQEFQKQSGSVAPKRSLSIIERSTKSGVPVRSPLNLTHEFLLVTDVLQLLGYLDPNALLSNNSPVFSNYASGTEGTKRTRSTLSVRR